MGRVIDIVKISDLNELKAGDEYTQVNFRSYSRTVSDYSGDYATCSRIFSVNKKIERTISYISSDYLLIEDYIILLNVEFEK
jgi:hypothetical protein